jgi:hypothetical protein
MRVLILCLLLVGCGSGSDTTPVGYPNQIVQTSNGNVLHFDNGATRVYKSMSSVSQGQYSTIGR